MFSIQIMNACARFPETRTERFLLYPALALYSPIEDLGKTSIGAVCTVFSLISLGLCPPINNAANWTRYSRGILTIPAQIIGNIFELHSTILTEYNIRTPMLCALANAAVDTASNNLNKSYPELLQMTEEKLKGNKDYLSDAILIRARALCTELFNTTTERKTDLLAKHIIFRACSILQTAACIPLSVIMGSLVSTIFMPIAIHFRGRKVKSNDLAFMILKMPILIHFLGLSLRMIVNPLQFVKKSATELEIDQNPKINAFKASGKFWKNPFEMQGP